MKPFCAFVVVLVLSPGVTTPCRAGEPPFEVAVANHLKQLDPKKNDARARLVALDWIGVHCTRDAKVRARVLPALQTCLGNDPEAKVRGKAAEILTAVARSHEPPVCPLALVRALLDPDVDVRTAAHFGALNFKKLPPEALAVLQRCARAEDPQIRRNTAEVASCYGKEDKALGLVRELTRDKHFWVRDGAQWALFRATDKLEDLVPYCVRMRVELRPKKPFNPKEPEAEPNERARKNLISYSSWAYLYRLTAERTDAMALLLGELACHESPQMREGVADFLAAFAQRVLSLRQPQKDEMKARIDDLEGRFSISKPFDPPRETREQAATRMTKVAARLRELKVVTALERLRDRDPEAGVRGAAAEALKAFAAVKSPQEELC
jgi:hypothetical protein